MTMEILINQQLFMVFKVHFAKITTGICADNVGNGFFLAKFRIVLR